MHYFTFNQSVHGYLGYYKYNTYIIYYKYYMYTYTKIEEEFKWTILCKKHIKDILLYIK